MAIQIKRTQVSEEFHLLNTALPLYLTDEFQVWHYAVLDEETVLVISSNSCQVQSFDETFNGKYSVAFDELYPCEAGDFQEVYAEVRSKIHRADQQHYASLNRFNLRLSDGFLPDTDERITAQAS
jgi:hypothetical protein